MFLSEDALPFRRLPFLALLLASLCAGLPGMAHAQAQLSWNVGDPSTLCGRETARQQAAFGIPAELLDAISMVESGRFDKERRASFAWPWTVTSGGEGKFLPTKAAAIAEVRALQAKGVKNIDVGCMQVNLKAHPDAFANLEEAFDPATNVGYAARFLKNLYESAQNWLVAGSWYHSQTPDLAAKYRAKLVAAWDREKKGGPWAVQLAEADEAAAGEPLAPSRPVQAGQIAPTRLARAEPAQPQSKRQMVNQAALQRVEAARIASAYREARLEEYRLRKMALASGRG